MGTVGSQVKTADKKFLEKAREFKFNASLDKSGKKKALVLFSDLLSDQFKYKIQQKENGFETFLANLIYDTETPVGLNLNKNWWSGKEIGYAAIKEFKESLEKNGYIERSNGCYGRDGVTPSFITRIWSSQKLKEAFKNISARSCDIFDLVELKTRKQRYKNGKIKKDKTGNDLLLKKSRKIPFKETRETMKLRRTLKEINRVNENTEITLDGVSLNVLVKAVYSESFNYHGRLYANGTNQFQQFSKEERSRILIDGEPVVELDYSGLHPRLLYAQESIQFNKDPYTVVNDNPEIRPFLKIMLLAMINNENINSAQSACNAWLNFDHIKDKKGMSAIKKYQKKMMTEKGMEKFKKQYRKAIAVKKTGITIPGLMEKFLQAHEPIRKYLCTGNKTGMKLMNKDAKIALDVCKHFAKQNIPILPIHDSFIVQAKYEQELREVMDKMYKKHANNYTCPIK